METRRILERLYRQRPRRPGPIRSLLRRARRARVGFIDWVRQHDYRLVAGSVLLAAWLVGHVYYYNHLVSLEFDVRAAQAKIQASQEKRHHIQLNVLRLLRHYEGYERDLMTEVTELRGSTEDGPSASQAPADASALQPLARLNAVAEQYPNLHLTRTVERLSEAVVNTESEIVARIDEYNDAANAYTTALRTFPGNIFGSLAGFEPVEFYEPPDRSSLEFQELDL